MSSGPGTRLGTINPISLMQFQQIHTLKRHKSGSSIKRNVCMLGHLSTSVQLDDYTMLYVCTPGDGIQLCHAAVGGGL